MITQWLPIIIVAIGVLCAYLWYKKPSDIPETTKASYALKVLQRLHAYSKANEIDIQDHRFGYGDIIEPYMKDLKIRMRERRDVVSFMLRKDLLNRDPPTSEYFYIVSSTGRQELETLAVARQLVAAAMEDLGRGDHESLKKKAELAAAAALAWHIDASSLTGREAAEAEQQAQSIEEAIKSHNLEKIDKILKRSSQVAQTAYYAYQILHGII